MGKKWDTVGNFYEWCKLRAEELHRVIKPGGFILIFGHPKTNHRMKCAFEDAGFNIVEEVDWIYFTGFPKNQDISKMFDKKANAERKVIGKSNSKGIRSGKDNFVGDNYKQVGYDITLPSSELAKKWDGWKTVGLKPAKEPITVFQKPLEGTYIENVGKWNCGGMNIDACRIKYNPNNERFGKYNDDYDKQGGFNYYEGGKKQIRSVPPSEGRFPPNIIFDEVTAKILDEQSGNRPSGKANGEALIGEVSKGATPLRRGNLVSRNNSGGGSRFFYCAKPSPKEKKLSDGTKNTHVTVKPISLLKWLIKLVTPKDGKTIDITSGSGTHGVSCEELNRDEGYNLKWINIEMMNTEKEPYCEIAKKRILDVVVKDT